MIAWGLVDYRIELSCKVDQERVHAPRFNVLTEPNRRYPTRARLCRSSQATQTTSVLRVKLLLSCPLSSTAVIL